MRRARKYTPTLTATFKRVNGWQLTRSQTDPGSARWHTVALGADGYVVARLEHPSQRAAELFALANKPPTPKITEAEQTRRREEAARVRRRVPEVARADL